MLVQSEHKQRTLAEAITKYLEETRVHKSRKTFLAYRVTLVLYAEHRTGITLTRKQRSCTEDIERVVAALDNTPVTVAKDDLLDYVALLKKRGNAARTLRNRVDHFQIFMHWTGQKSVLTENNLPRFTEKKVKAYQRSVLDRMMEHATIDEADLLTFFLCTGVREQEAQYACWTDVDLEAKVHTVTEHLDLGYTPKDKEEGDIQLPDVLVDRLRARRERMPHTRLIFPGAEGKANGHILRVIKRLALRAGVNCGHCVNKRGLPCATHAVCRHVILHKLRKTYATVLHKNGVSARTIMRLLRHSALDTSLRYIADQDEDEVFDASNKAFAGFGGAA
jgi:integrase/recombinase XerD